MSWYWIAGLSGLFAPMILFEIGKCHIRRELRKNILELQKIKETSNEEMAHLIEIHFDELQKIDEGLFKTFYKNKNL
jgi:hypothetical protein